MNITDKFNINNNVLSEYFWHNKNVIMPWGVEFADSNSFFSMENGKGHRAQILYSESECQSSIYSFKYRIKMSEGLVEVIGADCICEDKIIRKLKLTALEDSKLLDFVMRFRFNKDIYEIAEIDNKEIKYAGTNKYYQYKCDHVLLRGKYGNVIVRTLKASTGENMDFYMYARDSAEDWVVHARMLPNCDENIVIKLCSKWFKTKPLPKLVTKIICRNKKIYNYLKYHNELTPYKSKFARTFNLNAYPLASIRAGESLEFEAEVIFSE